MMRRISKIFRGVVAFAMAAGGICSGAEALEVYEPQRHGIDRYEQIWIKSPFIVETTVVQQSDGLEKQFALTGLAELAGKPVAFLLDRRTLERVSVAQGDESKSGVELVSVDFNADVRQSKATIRMGDREAAISYDPTMLMQVDQGSGQQGQGPMPPPPPGGQPMPIRPPNPGLPNDAAMVPGAPDVPGAAQIIRRRTIKVPTE